MVQLAWGNALSVIAPGVVLLFAVSLKNNFIGTLLKEPNSLSFGGVLLLAVLAALAGGVLEAARRCTFDQWLSRCVNPDRANIYGFLTPENQALFQTGVENSYKYYAFYGNLLWAIVVLVAVRLYSCAAGPTDIILAVVIVVVGRAGYIQYMAYEERTKKFIEQEQARREKGDHS